MVMSAMTVVCDGWIEPKHPRRLLRRGDADAGVSFGMCDACAMALLAAGNDTRFGSAANDADFGEALLRVYAACAGLSIGDRLTVLQIAWLAIAGNARTEAQMRLDGFLEEQVRQLTQLRKMFALVDTDEPDLEIERLYFDGDREGMRRRMEAIMDPAMDMRDPPG
jgi:hypothetical protein